MILCFIILTNNVVDSKVQIMRGAQLSLRAHG